MATIKTVFAREVLDSRGNPTVEVDVTLSGGSLGRAIVPSGASTGEREALELRDQDPRRFLGKGVLKAVQNVNKILSPEIQGRTFKTQKDLDQMLLNLDGTPNKEKLGANAILAVSMAFAKAQAVSQKKQLFETLQEHATYAMPVPLMNILNGGAHANNNLDIQEFMILPVCGGKFSKALQTGVEIFHTLKKLLSSNGVSIAVGDEGGFAQNLYSNEAALDLILQAIEKAGFTPGKDVYLALDCAASEFYKEKSYVFQKDKKTTEEMIQFYERLISKYPILSIEDPLDQNDWEGWQKLTHVVGQKVQIVGDDIFVTNPKILKDGISKKVANAILIKLNQIGTVTETLQTIELAKASSYGTVISHRSGETEDTTIADLAVGTCAGQIKTGSASRTDRMCKYNQLLRIEEFLGSKATFEPSRFLKA